MKQRRGKTGGNDRGRPEKDGSEILYGVHAVSEALAAGRRRFEKIMMSRDKGGAASILDTATRLHIPVETVPRVHLDTVTNQAVHQGVAAMVSPFPCETKETFSHITGNHHEPFLLILDSIVDPHNLGALIRTALCVGVDAIIIPKDRSVKPSPAVSKASAGAMEHSSIYLVTNVAKTIAELKEMGLWVAGLDRDTDNRLYKTDLTGPMAIVVGGEDKGVRPLVKKQCDFLIAIPQKGAVNSLNASVAGAVVMYEAFRQRMSANSRI